MGSSPTGPTFGIFVETRVATCLQYTSTVIYPLLTERLSIEPLTLSDLEPFVRYRQDPEVARYQSWEPSYSQNQALELIESQEGVSLPSPGNWLQLAIHDRTTAELFGDLAIHALENEANCFEIGFTISRENQNKGFAKEAASRLIEHLIAEVQAKSFIATPDARNKASIALLLSLGFRQDVSKSWTEEFKGETVRVLYLQRG